MHRADAPRCTSLALHPRVPLQRGCAEAWLPASYLALALGRLRGASGAGCSYSAPRCPSLHCVGRSRTRGAQKCTRSDVSSLHRGACLCSFPFRKLSLATPALHNQHQQLRPPFIKALFRVNNSLTGTAVGNPLPPALTLTGIAPRRAWAKRWPLGLGRLTGRPYFCP